jgi:hypothetical protein
MKTKIINPLVSSEVRIMGLPFYKENVEYLRFPKSLFSDIIKENPSLEKLGFHTSGVAFQFSTNSASIILDIELNHVSLMNHMPISGESGFDVYYKDIDQYRFLDVARPSPNQKNVQYEIHAPAKNTMITYMIYAPLYNGIKKFELIIDESAVIEYRSEDFNKKWLFYGTSITQGACASRPGMSYPAIISRMCDVEVINYGFSGNGLGEKSVINAMNKIDNIDKIFIDYEANAGSANLLVKTLEPMVNSLRISHAHTPIYIMSRLPFPKEFRDHEAHTKRMFHKEFQMNFVLENQHLKPLYFIDGDNLHPISTNESTVDGLHLNDLGFYHLSTSLINELNKT